MILWNETVGSVAGSTIQATGGLGFEDGRMADKPVVTTLPCNSDKAFEADLEPSVV